MFYIYLKIRKEKNIYDFSKETMEKAHMIDLVYDHKALVKRGLWKRGEGGSIDLVLLKVAKNTST